MTRSIRLFAVVAIALALLIGTPTRSVAQETGGSTGQVTMRLILSGDVDTRDNFLVIVDCSDPWCADESVGEGLPDGKLVNFCGAGLADIPQCDEGTFQFSRELQTGPIEYWYYFSDDTGDSWQLIYHGSGTIHSGNQTITVEYRYGGAAGGGSPPGGEPTGPTLPDTAMAAP